MVPKVRNNSDGDPLLGDHAGCLLHLVRPGARLGCFCKGCGSTKLVYGYFQRVIGFIEVLQGVLYVCCEVLPG